MIPSTWADDFFSPPELEPQPPPWIQDSQDQGQNQDQQDQQQDQQQGQQPPDDGPPPGFWGEPPEDEEMSSPSFSPSSRPDAAPKDSFQLTEPWNDVLEEEKRNQSCLGWGHPLLGVNIHQSQNSCDFQLRRKVDQSRQSIRALEDHTRSLILKEVIKGHIERDRSKQITFQYDLVNDVLIEAKMRGCRCLQ